MAEVTTKKRKRTGKQREEAKKAAIVSSQCWVLADVQAKAAAEAAGVAEPGEAEGEDEAVAPEPETTESEPPAKTDTAQTVTEEDKSAVDFEKLKKRTVSHVRFSELTPAHGSEEAAPAVQAREARGVAAPDQEDQVPHEERVDVRG